MFYTSNFSIVFLFCYFSYVLWGYFFFFGKLNKQLDCAESVGKVLCLCCQFSMTSIKNMLKLECKFLGSKVKQCKFEEIEERVRERQRLLEKNNVNVTAKRSP